MKKVCVYPQINFHTGITQQSTKLIWWKHCRTHSAYEEQWKLCSHHKYKGNSNLVSIIKYDNWGAGCIRYFKHSGELRVGNHKANGKSGYTIMVLEYTLMTWYSGNSKNISPLLNKRYKLCPFISPSERWLIESCNLEGFTVNTYIIWISRQIYWVW